MENKQNRQQVRFRKHIFFIGKNFIGENFHQAKFLSAKFSSSGQNQLKCRFYSTKPCKIKYAIIQ